MRLKVFRLKTKEKNPVSKNYVHRVFALKTLSQMRISIIAFLSLFAFANLFSQIETDWERPLAKLQNRFIMGDGLKVAEEEYCFFHRQGIDTFQIVKIDESGKLLWKTEVLSLGTHLETPPKLLLENGEMIVLDITSDKTLQKRIYREGFRYLKKYDMNFLTTFARIDKDGQLIEEKQLTIPDAKGVFVPDVILETNAKDAYLIVGRRAEYFYSGQCVIDGEKLWILKIDKQGNLLWEKQHKTINISKRLSIVSNVEGTGYLVNTMTTDKDDSWGSHILEFNEEGDVIQFQEIRGQDHLVINSISKTENNTYLLAGGNRSYCFRIGFCDYSYVCWVAEYDADWKLLWENNFGQKHEPYIHEPMKDDLTEHCNSSTVFDIEPIEGGYLLLNSIRGKGKKKYSQTLKESWLTKLDSRGNVIWEERVGNKEVSYFHKIISTNSKNKFCLFGAIDITFLDPEVEWKLRYVPLLRRISIEEGFLFRQKPLLQTATLVRPIDNKRKLTLFFEEFEDKPKEIFQVRILTEECHLIKEYSKMAKDAIKIDLRDQESGVYFIVVRRGENTITKKVIVQ